MMTACKPTTPATGTQSLLSTGPETGRGQASLWTAAAAPDHRLWTTLRGPLDPSSLPTCPLPRRRRRASRYLSITTNQRRDDLQPTASPSRRAGAGEHRQAQTAGPYLSIEVGHTGLSKAGRTQEECRGRTMVSGEQVRATSASRWYTRRHCLSVAFSLVLLLSAGNAPVEAQQAASPLLAQDARSLDDESFATR